jgi:S-formylglutathione hydrolase FrmB
MKHLKILLILCVIFTLSFDGNAQRRKTTGKKRPVKRVVKKTALPTYKSVGQPVTKSTDLKVTDSLIIPVNPVDAFNDFFLDSRLMNRKMPYRVILPRNYNKNTNEKYPVLYLLHGLTGHFDDWWIRSKISDYVFDYNYIVIMPEGDNGWYSDSATVPSNKYESYIIKELIPEIDNNLRTLSSRENRAIAGLSMGGFGSLKFGLKYPQMFGLVGSFSGVIGAASYTKREMGGEGILSNTIMTAFGKRSSATRKSNDIFKMIKTITPKSKTSLPFFYVDCGTEDFLITSNRAFSTILFEKKIPHEFRQFPGNHDWKIFDEQVIEFLELSKKHIKGAKAEK